MNHTPNYQLNQWEADDRVQRVDFNADNAKIDAALAGLPVELRRVKLTGAAKKITLRMLTWNNTPGFGWSAHS